MPITEKIKVEKKTKKGWKTTTLKEIGKIVSGGTPSTTNSSYFGGDIAWLTPADLTGYKQKYIATGSRNITVEGLKNSSARLFPKGSIIFSSRAPIGYVAIAANEMATNQGFKNITPNSDVDCEYIYYYLKSAKQLVESFASGTTFKEISAKAFGEIPIPLPPLPEQHRIVEKIAELFSELDYAITALKSSQKQLKTFRASVLKYAFEGHFTGGMSGWQKKNIQEIAKINPKLPFEKIEDQMEVSFLPMRRVAEEVNKIDLSESKKYYEVKKGFTPFTNGDVIFAKITPCMENGKIAIVQDLKNEIGFGSTEFHVFRCSNDLYNKYLFYYFVQETFRREAEFNMTGAVGQKRVPKLFLECHNLPLPKINIQKRIVAEIETRLSESDYLLQTINRQLTHAESLRQSILQRAFSGELVKSEVRIENGVTANQIAKFIPVNTPFAKTKITKETRIAAILSTTDLHAGIIARVIKSHKDNIKYRHNLNHVKCEKIAHLCEAFLELELGRTPVKDAAGPDDYPHLKKVESRASKANWFKVERHDNEIGYHYIGLNGLSGIIEKTESFLAAKNVEVDNLIELFLPLDKEKAEVVATVFAAWNNLLLKGISPSDEEIVYEARENWSKEKLKINREHFFSSLIWIRKKDLVPKGVGKYVHIASKKKKTKTVKTSS